jgi:triacylglycerol lipase
MCPIVLHHGLFGFGNVRVGPIHIPYFAGGIERALSGRGHRLLITRVHPTAGVADRARQLKESILRNCAASRCEDRQMVVIAHSMGGLDARYMISRLGMHDRVRALLTISTPHRGSSAADWVMHHVGQRLGAARLVTALGLNWRAVFDLTRRQCGLFNDQVPDMPGVRYFSISAALPARQMPKMLIPWHNIIAPLEGENDGLVSVTSSAWGTHLGVWPVDHFHTINKSFPKSMQKDGNISPGYVAALEAMERAGIDLSGRP